MMSSEARKIFKGGFLALLHLSPKTNLIEKLQCPLMLEDHTCPHIGAGKDTFYDVKIKISELN